MEQVTSGNYADARIEHDLALTARLPPTLAGMVSGLISADRADVIAGATASLPDTDAAHADEAPAAVAPGLRVDQLSKIDMFVFCVVVVTQKTNISSMSGPHHRRPTRSPASRTSSAPSTSPPSPSPTAPATTSTPRTATPPAANSGTSTPPTTSRHLRHPTTRVSACLSRNHLPAAAQRRYCVRPGRQAARPRSVRRSCGRRGRGRG